MGAADRPLPRQAGLTLIEMMIGLAICAVLMSLAVPSLSAHLQRHRLKAAAQGLELDLREARYESAQRGAPLSLVFSPGADWCYAITTSADCNCREQQACRIKAVRATDLRGVQLLEPRGTRFDPATGHAEQAGTLAVWQAGGQQVRVSVSMLGRPQVCTLDGSLPPIPGC